MKLNNIKTHPKYWVFHKDIYNSEIDSLDEEIRKIILDKPYSGTATRFNDRVDRLIADKIEESNY